MKQKGGQNPEMAYFLRITSTDIMTCHLQKKSKVCMTSAVSNQGPLVFSPTPLPMEPSRLVCRRNFTL